MGGLEIGRVLRAGARVPLTVEGSGCLEDRITTPF